MSAVDWGFVLYVGMGTLLFFFWFYGIAAFARDLGATYLPAVRRWRAGRRADGPERAERGESERAEAERDLL